MNNKLQIDGFDVLVNKNRQAVLLNHFLSEVFDTPAVHRKKPMEYSKEEYLSVLEVVTAYKTDNVSDIATSVQSLNKEDREIFYSFIKLSAPDYLDQIVSLSIKDYLAADLFLEAFFKFQSLED